MTTKAPGNQASQPSPFPDLSTIPFAVPLPPEKVDHLVEDSDLGSQRGDVDLLSGNVQIALRGYHLRADIVRFNRSTQEIEAEGHIRFTDADADSFLEASHGSFNLHTGTGRFYDVTGSAGLHRPAAVSGTSSRLGLQNANPFLFTGRLVEKTGPDDYNIYDGTVTSCLLPSPEWLFAAHRLAVQNGKVHARGAIFHLLGVPVLPLPYLTAPVRAGQRQSGLLIPVLGDSSTKGITVGQLGYITFGRSADLTAGTVYYSLRGFSETGTFRYRGLGNDFIIAHVSALQDRGYFANNGVYVQQGGQDVTAAFRRQVSPNIRIVGDGEYLSSYIYREAFTDTFNQAVSSDITSIGYITRQTNGWSMDARADRYQGLKQVPIGSSPGEQVHVLHVPAFDIDSLEQPLGKTPFRWSLDASVAGLKRAQPNFTSSGIIERVDFRPELSLPLHFDGFNVRGSVALRETFYSRSRKTPYAAGAPPVELTNPLNRADVEMEISVRPPAVERTFAVPTSLRRLFGTEVRHTVEPEITYRDVRGVDNFLAALRFDDTDLVSDTNELEYGVTQHLYFRPLARAAPRPPAGCPAENTGESQPGTGEDAVSPTTGDANGAAPFPDEEEVPDVLTPSPADSTDANGIPVPSSAAPDVPIRTHARHASRCHPLATTAQQPLVSWRVTQRHFFDPSFGGAVVLRRRNIFESTLSLSGIAFLTEPRSISPVVSRLRVRTSSHTDVEWDFDLDTGASRFTSSNIFLDAHEGPWFGGLSYARLNAPGRFATEVIDTNQNASLVTSPTSNFSQLRMLLGYGVPSRPGLAIAANSGLDLISGSLQYAALQTSYNWNCCGLAVEYRKFELGSVRNENSYRFNFTLANIGSAGNIRRAERLF